MFCIVLAFSSLISANLTYASGESVVGVKPGDWVQYGCWVTKGWFSNVRKSIKLQFQDVSEDNVTVQVFVKYVDGHEENMTQSGDVRNVVSVGFGGESPDPYFAPCILPKNISVDDPAFNSLLAPLVRVMSRNQNFSITYSAMSCDFDGAIRDVNIANCTYEALFYPLTAYFADQYCWDKSTGVLLEVASKYYLPDPDLNISDTEEGLVLITGTSLWNPPEVISAQAPKLVLLGMIAAGVSSSPLLLKLRTRRRKRESE